MSERKLESLINIAKIQKYYQCNPVRFIEDFFNITAGTSHGNDYQIADPEAACITNAKWQLIMLTLLLEKGGERAKKVMAEFKPLFASKEEFLAFQDSLCAEGDRITYRDDGVAEVRI